MAKAFVVISPEEGSNAEAIPRKVMASRLTINSKVVQAIPLETVLYHALSLTQNNATVPPLKTGWRKEMLIEKGWSCG